MELPAIQTPSSLNPTIKTPSAQNKQMQKAEGEQNSFPFMTNNFITFPAYFFIYYIDLIA